MVKSKVAHFSTGFTTAQFQENEDGSVVKRALVLVEGEHKDNKSRSHLFTPERIELIAENSNRAFSSGARIPVLKDHVKTTDAEVGDIDSPFEVRVISEEDLPDKRHKHLLGKVGIFCEGVVIKAKDMVEKVKAGLGKTISPGIDIMSNTIRELSITPTPAIQGLALYSMEAAKNALSFDELEMEKQNDEELKEQFEEVSEKFYCIMQNILNASEEMLAGQDPYELIDTVFSDYFDRLQMLFQVDDGEEAEDGGVTPALSPYSMAGNQMMEAPYSLYSYDAAEFAFPGSGFIGNAITGSKNFFKRWGDDIANSGKILNSNLPNAKKWENIGALNKRRSAGVNRLDKWGRPILTGVGALGAGYGAYKLGQMGGRALGIGRQEQKPWYRFGM